MILSQWQIRMKTYWPGAVEVCEVVFRGKLIVWLTWEESGVAPINTKYQLCNIVKAPELGEDQEKEEEI